MKTRQDQHEKAIEKLYEIQSLENEKQSLIDSAEGIGGYNFPELRLTWIKKANLIEVEIKKQKEQYNLILKTIKPCSIK